MDCKVVLAQVEPTLGNLNANLDLHRREVEAARAAGADLVLFPELSLTGYFLKDQTAEVARRRDAPELQRLVELSRDLTIGVGFVEEADDGRLFNAYALLEGGAVLGVHRKVHLVTYGMFEEARDLASGERFETFESRHGRLGVLVCEDLWHVGASWVHFLAGADAILVPSAGPARGVAGGDTRPRSGRVWNTLLDAFAMLYQTWMVYVNRVGSEDGILFGGGSRVVDPHGREAAALPDFASGRLEVRLSSAVQRRARVQTPLRRDEKPWIVAREIERWTGAHRP